MLKLFIRLIDILAATLCRAAAERGKDADTRFALRLNGSGHEVAHDEFGWIYRYTRSPQLTPRDANTPAAN